jgi:hypothetical protein
LPEFINSEGGVAAPLKPLTIRQILQWADLHHQYTGRWPTSRCGPVMYGSEDTRTWEGVNTALAKGTCGLPGGTSLRQLLAKRRGARDPRLARPNLSIKQILAWADSHQQRTGEWPYRDAGQVAEARDISWNTIDRYLKRGVIDNGKRTTLANLLRDMRGVWDGGKPLLTEKLILKWADAHHNRTGRWPVTLSGDVIDQPGENWAAIDMALRNARRGITRKISLSQLLRRERGKYYYPKPEPLTARQVLAWADVHFRRTGRWPTRKSGPVYGAPGEKWSSIDLALTHGTRGLPGGQTLAQFLDQHRR